jgi:hypothetical protein
MFAGDRRGCDDAAAQLDAPGPAVRDDVQRANASAALECGGELREAVAAAVDDDDFGVRGQGAPISAAGSRTRVSITKMPPGAVGAASASVLVVSVASVASSPCCTSISFADVAGRGCGARAACGRCGIGVDAGRRVDRRIGLVHRDADFGLLGDRRRHRGVEVQPRLERQQ